MTKRKAIFAIILGLPLLLFGTWLLTAAAAPTGPAPITSAAPWREVTGNIVTSGEVVSYTFTAEAGQIAGIALHIPEPSSLAGEVTLLKAGDGLRVQDEVYGAAFASFGPADAGGITAAMPEAGNYYIQVDADDGGDGATGAFILRFNLIDPAPAVAVDDDLNECAGAATGFVQAAARAVPADGTITVCAGEYTSAHTIRLQQPGVTLQGEGMANTLIRAQDSTTLQLGATDLTLDGLTLHGGTRRVVEQRYGHTIDRLTVANCRIEGPVTALELTDAYYTADDVTVQNCVLQVHSGGTSNRTGVLLGGNGARIRDNVINTISSGEDATFANAGINVTGDDAEITGNVVGAPEWPPNTHTAIYVAGDRPFVEQNTIAGYSWGIYIGGFGESGSTATIRANRLHGETVGGNPPLGIFVSGVDQALVSENLIADYPDLVRGITLSSSGGRVVNNRVTIDRFFGIQSTDPDDVRKPATFINNTVVHKSASYDAQGLSVRYDGAGAPSMTLPITLTNNLLSAPAFEPDSQNFCGVDSSRPLQHVSHNLIAGYAIAFCNEAALTPGGEHVAPGEAGLVDDQLHLQQGSAAVDAGTATGAPGADFEGTPRPINGVVDIGADEWGAPIEPHGGYTETGTLEPPSTATGNFRAVALAGGFAYVLTNQGTLLTYDISPLSEDGFTTLNAPLHTLSLENGFGLLQRGNALYAYGSQGVQPVDLADPAAPVAAAATDDASIINAQLRDNYLVGAADGAVVVYDLGAGSPTLVDAVPLAEGAQAYSVQIFDGVIAVRHTGGGTDPAAYSVVAYASLENLGTATRIADAALAHHQLRFGDRLVACTDSTLELWDVSTPAAPFRLTTTTLAEVGAGRICIRDGQRIITNGSVHTVEGARFTRVGAFEPTHGQSDLYPYTGAANLSFLFVTQDERVLVLNRPAKLGALLVGAPGEMVGDADSAGAANVLYGHGGPLSPFGNELWRQGNDGIPDAADADDFFGDAVTSGDFNGDGYEDVAISAPSESVGDAAAAGTVTVLYGAHPGVQPAESQIWHQDSAGIPGTAGQNEKFGAALAAGDVNGDGYADLIVGAPLEDVGVARFAGVAYVIYGSRSGLTAAGSQIWHQNRLAVGDGADEFDQFGFSVAAGDFNGDGYADLVAGVPLEDIDGVTDAGAAHVLYGSAEGITDAGSQVWHQESDYLPDQAEAEDYFGAALAVADMNGDGIDDLAIGASGESIEAAGASGAGAVHVLFGYPAGLVGWGSQIWHQDSPGVAGQAEKGDTFGVAVAAADFNDDGYADLAIGADGEGLESLTESGAVNVLYGTACGPSGSGDQIWTQNTDGVLGEAESGDNFGRALATGDLNGDGFADLAIGVPGESVGDQANAGAAHVVYGSSTGLTVGGNQLWHQNRPGIAGGAEDGDLFGNALAILQPPAPPPPPASSDILDLDSVGWRSGRNYTDSAFGERFDELTAAGYMLVDIETDEFDGAQRVGDVWQRNVDNRAWHETRDLTLAQWETLQQTRKDAGLRLIDQEVYLLDGAVRYAGIWIENREGLAWDNDYDVTSSEFSSLFNTFYAQGYMLIDVDAYVVDGQLLYSGIWVDNVDNLKWHEWRNMSSEEFSSKFDQYHSRFRMTDVESYRHDGKQYYAGIWVENRNGREWYEQRGLSSKGFGELWSELRDLGFRLVDYEVYPSSDGWEYAGIWRQNGDRYDWPLRCAVDRLLKEEVAGNEIPGMSVAIAQNGRWRYLRGFGYADVDDSVDADSRTVYRLASVSKAVAGVLALRLVEDETVSLDLGAPTRDYVADMPVHHTHTVSQTLSNWAGIGHYSGDYPDYKEWIDADYDPDADEDEEGPDDNFEPDHFDTALAAARTMWHAPLSYPPPGSTYRYSSFGFTFAGAALEGAAGESVPTLLRDHLRVPFDLSTLRPDRNGPDPRRSLIYGDSNQEISPDDISWKLLGGGLEGSAYDLARLGNGLLDGTILTSESREVLWSPADSQVTYGLGWDITTVDGRQVVLHTGHQAGANSYLRIYPDEEIVIVLLSNRRRGHETGPMGIEIGRQMIDALAMGGAENQLLSPAQELGPDEPDTEGLPPEYVVWPESNPVGTVDDYTDPTQGPIVRSQNGLLYLPAITR